MPLLAVADHLAVNLANFGAAGVPGWWAVLLVVIGVAVTLWAANALVITSLFAFRARDVARLAAYFLVPHARRHRSATPLLLVVAAGVIAVSSEAVLAAAGLGARAASCCAAAAR